MISAPILRYPNFDQLFYLYTDVSGTGLGAVLAQKDKKNKKYTVAYISRSLTKAKWNYAATKLECLVVI